MNSKNCARTTTDAITNPSHPEVVEPEWAKVAYVVKRFQIGRTTAFRNIQAGTWKSVLLREKHKKSGIRLVYVPSVRSHLADLAAQQSVSRVKGKGR